MICHKFDFNLTTLNLLSCYKANAEQIVVESDSGYLEIDELIPPSETQDSVMMSQKTGKHSVRFVVFHLHDWLINGMCG